MKKRLFLAMAALVSVTLSFAQEYMIIENVNGGIARYDVNVIKQAYFKTYEATGTGTADDPFNVAAANAKCKEIGSEFSSEKYYVKGLIIVDTNNSSFYIADDLSGINSIPFTNELGFLNGELKKGDEVVVNCSLYCYNNLTPKASGLLVSVNGQPIETPQPQGSGTLEDPYNVLAAIEFISSLGTDVPSEEDIYIKGRISSILDPFGSTYGNATFYISDLGNSWNQLLIYRTLYLGNVKYTDGNPNIQQGDEVIICGKVVNYKGATPETYAYKSYVYSLNGNTSGGGGETNGAKGTGTENDPFNIAAAIAKCQEIGETASTEKYYVKGVVVTGGKVSGGYGNVTFKMGDSTDATELFTAYQVAGSDGEKLPDGFEVTVGSTVIVYGPIINYKGKSPETAGRSAAQIVTIDGKKTNEGSGGGGGSETGADGSAIISVADFNAASESTDVWYQLTGTVKNLKDGDQYGNFDLEDSTGSVYVYGLLSEKGGARKKFQELATEKGIANGKTITIVGNRGSYNGKIEVTNAYFISIK